MSSWLILSVAGCTPSGRYVLTEALYVLDPQPAVGYENALDGHLLELTVSSGDLGPLADLPGDGLSASYEYLVEGLYAELRVLPDDRTYFTFGGNSLEGFAEGEGWSVSGGSVRERLEPPPKENSYWWSALEGVEFVTELTLTPVGSGIHGEGTIVRAVTTGWRESDEWLSLDDGSILGGVYDEAGELVENQSRRDDCDGDYCERSTVDRSEFYRVAFDAARVGP